MQNTQSAELTGDLTILGSWCLLTLWRIEGEDDWPRRGIIQGLPDAKQVKKFSPFGLKQKISKLLTEAFWALSKQDWIRLWLVFGMCKGKDRGVSLAIQSMLQLGAVVDNSSSSLFKLSSRQLHWNYLQVSLNNGFVTQTFSLSLQRTENTARTGAGRRLELETRVMRKFPKVSHFTMTNQGEGPLLWLVSHLRLRNYAKRS